MGSEFDANYSRLKSILVLFLFLFFVYTCEVMIFGTGQENIDDLTATGENYNVPTNPSIWESIGQVINGVFSMIVLFVQIVTFTLPAIPTWMTIILAPVFTSILIVGIYLTVDTIYAIIKALPFT